MNQLKDINNHIYPKNVLQKGNLYGYPAEIWNTFNVKQKRAAAYIFAMAYPEITISAGAQEILDSGTLSLRPIRKNKLRNDRID